MWQQNNSEDHVQTSVNKLILLLLLLSSPGFSTVGISLTKIPFPLHRLFTDLRLPCFLDGNNLIKAVNGLQWDKATIQLGGIS